MNSKKTVVGVLSLGVVIVSVVLVSNVYAYQGDPGVQGSGVSTETHEAMTAAFENGDYNAWKANKPNQGNGRMMEVINNEETFAKFVVMREARLAGDIETADAIRTELGLGQGMKGNGMHGGKNKDVSRDNSFKSGTRGQNQGLNFVDANSDGVCDSL